MRTQFHAEQWLPYPVPFVFAFFANPQNLPRLMPAWQKTRIEEATLAPPPPRPPETPAGTAAGAGTRMTISFRPFPLSPIRVPWEAEIPEFVWNDHFCDIQLRGPFAYWRHCHRVASETRTRAGTTSPVQGTLVHDEVTYELPLGSLGTLAQRLVMPAQFRSIFAYRQKKTAELLARLATRASAQSQANLSTPTPP